MHMCTYYIHRGLPWMSPSIPDTSKVVPPHPFETFAHRPTILILRPMSFVQLFVLPDLELSSLNHQIQKVQSFQHHALPWKRLSNFFLKQIIIILVINFVFLLLFLHLLFLQLFLWPVQRLLWATSVTNTPTAMCGRVDFLRQGLMLCWVQLTGKQR